MHTVPPTYPRGHTDRIIDPPLLRLEPGARIVNSRGILGTLGCFALTLDDRRVVFLTSQHVLFGAGAREQEPVWLHDAATRRRAGRTRHGRRGIVKHGGREVHVDCATAELDAALVGEAGFTTQSPGADLACGQSVHMLGAATGATHGIVISTSHSEQVVIEGRAFEVRGQILVRTREPARTFSRPGDSGATLHDAEGAVVGLLWGTSSRGDAIACPIAPVLWVLHVELAHMTENA